jgi:hypothetical protein
MPQAMSSKQVLPKIPGHRPRARDVLDARCWVRDAAGRVHPALNLVAIR